MHGHRRSGRGEDASDGEGPSKGQGQQGPAKQEGKGEGSVEDRLDSRSLWLTEPVVTAFTFY